MRRIEIPRQHYLDELPAASAADAIEVEVEPPANGARGTARLTLWPLSADLTNIRASVSMPRCLIGAPSASPRPIDLTASLPGTQGRCEWRHALARKAVPITYEVPFSTSDLNTLRFEFRLRTEQLARPILLTVDLEMSATQGDEGTNSPPGEEGQGGAG